MVSAATNRSKVYIVWTVVFVNNVLHGLGHVLPLCSRRVPSLAAFTIVVSLARMSLALRNNRVAG